MQMDSLLPDWLEKGVESTLRDSDDDHRPLLPAPTALSSLPIVQKSRAMASPVVLTPTTRSRPGSRQDASKGTFAQDLESFYADAVSSDEDESEDESEGSDGENESEDENEEEGEDMDADEEAEPAEEDSSGTDENIDEHGKVDPIISR
jgi:AP-3 complex subunit beta